MTDHIREPFNQKLYQMYCWLCDISTELSAIQAAFVIEEIQRIAGYPSTSKHFAFNGEDVSFRELLSLLENLFLDRKELECTIDALFDRYIAQVISKGFVLYKRQSSGGIGCVSRRIKWSSVWYSMHPGTLLVHRLKGKTLKEKITIQLDKNSSIKPMYQDGPNFISELQTGSDLYQFSHFDANSCRLFEKGLQISITFLTQEELNGYDKRTANRFHGQEIEMEGQKRERLEKEKLRLQMELEEERRALKDEEIVRGLATRMLEEERLKSEQMERVLQELQNKLYFRREDELMEPEDINDLEHHPYSADEQQMLREYVHEIGQMDDDGALIVPDGDEEIWNRQDQLIISTQSI